jgi:hypothetical protein
MTGTTNALAYYRAALAELADTPREARRAGRPAARRLERLDGEGRRRRADTAAAWGAALTHVAAQPSRG